MNDFEAAAKRFHRRGNLKGAVDAQPRVGVSNLLSQQEQNQAASVSKMPAVGKDVKLSQVSKEGQKLREQIHKDAGGHSITPKIWNPFLEKETMAASRGEHVGAGPKRMSNLSTPKPIAGPKPPRPLHEVLARAEWKRNLAEMGAPKAQFGDDALKQPRPKPKTSKPPKGNPGQFHPTKNPGGWTE